MHSNSNAWNESLLLLFPSLSWKYFNGAPLKKLLVPHHHQNLADLVFSPFSQTRGQTIHRPPLTSSFERVLCPCSNGSKTAIEIDILLGGKGRCFPPPHSILCDISYPEEKIKSRSIWKKRSWTLKYRNIMENFHFLSLETRHPCP